MYIARGALTDESEYESDADNKASRQQTANLNNNNLDKGSHLNSHINSHVSSKHSYYSNQLSHSNVYQPHRSAIRSMFACLAGRQHPANLSILSKENYPSQHASTNYYYDAGLDSCVRRKKAKKSKNKSSKKKRSCKGPNNYCYYCTSHNYPSSASQAPSRTSNQSTTTTLQTAGGASSHRSAALNGNLPSSNLNSNSQNNNQNNIENASMLSGNRNLSNQSSSKNQNHHLNVKNSCGLSPSPELDSQQALLSNYSDRSSCHSGHNSINSSNYKDYITNYCSKTSSYNHDCHPECARKSSQSDLQMKHEITSLSSAGKASRSHTSSPMQISYSPPKTQNLTNAIIVTAETHSQQKIDSQTDLTTTTAAAAAAAIQPSSTAIEKSNNNSLTNSNLGETVICTTKDPPSTLTEQQQITSTTTIATIAATVTSVPLAQQPPSQMDFVEQLHQFQQQYLKQHPEVITEEQLVQVATECNPNNNQQQQQQIEQNTNSIQPVSGTVGTVSVDADFKRHKTLQVQTDKKMTSYF